MGTRQDNIILNKSMEFAIRIVELYKFLVGNKEYVISKQLLRSGTSIGANLREANEGYSRKDFLAKVYISLKEARESEYWLELLWRTSYIDDDQYNEIQNHCGELCKILTSIAKTTSQSINKD